MRWDEDAQKSELLMECNLVMEMSITLLLRRSHGDETCYNYILNRWPVLKPEILEKSRRTGEDPEDIFHRFQKGVHERHETLDSKEAL